LYLTVGRSPKIQAVHSLDTLLLVVGRSDTLLATNKPGNLIDLVTIVVVIKFHKE
jgi:hypothetical protein